MTAMQATLLVAGREIGETVRRKSFWAVLGVLLLAGGAAVVVPSLLDDDATRYRVAVVGSEPGLDEALRASVEPLDATVRTSPAPDADEARRRVLDGDADLAIVAGTPARIIVETGQNADLAAASAQALSALALTRGLEERGVDPGRIGEVLSDATPTIDEVDRTAAERQAASFIISLVLYILLVTLMVQAANGTAIEKSNRISEVLLAVVRPGPLLFGKVIGISTIGLATFSAGLLPVVISLAVGGDLPAGIGGALAGGLLWFVLGLVLYLILAGSLGALAERPEETGVVVAPLTFVLVGAFIVSQSSADSTVGMVLGYVPVSSPLVMPARIAQGLASGPEMVVSALILVATVAVAARAGAVVYARAIVRTGRRLKLGDVLRSPST